MEPECDERDEPRALPVILEADRTTGHIRVCRDGPITIVPERAEILMHVCHLPLSPGPHSRHLSAHLTELLLTGIFFWEGEKLLQ